MCGRYTLYDADQIDKRYNLANKAKFVSKDNYNVAPRQSLPIIRGSSEGPVAELMQWGFIPVWAKDLSKERRPINTVSETVFEKPMWRGAIKNHRCLVPARGFYEWTTAPDGRKQPYYIHPKDIELFSFAGIYSVWKDVEGLPLYTFSILTTKPNKEMEAIHDRMPVILDTDEEAAWLDPDLTEPDRLSDLMQPYRDGGLEIYRVDPAVNSPRNNRADLLKPVG